jgi:hypothetical protein
LSIIGDPSFVNFCRRSMSISSRANAGSTLRGGASDFVMKTGVTSGAIAIRCYLTVERMNTPDSSIPALPPKAKSIAQVAAKREMAARIERRRRFAPPASIQ